MAFTARDVMVEASRTLRDATFVRWTPPELLEYVNAAVRAVVERKPTATTATVTLDLDLGTLQTLPAAYTVLSRVTRNLTSPHPTPVGGKAVRALADTSLLDAQIPGWQDSEVLPFAKVVEHVIQDAADPRTFLVVPGNDGTGMLEAIVGTWPAPIPAPAGALAQSALNYTAAVPLPDAYRNAVLNFVLHKAYAKDSAQEGAAARAVAHLEMFTTALSDIGGSETALGLATRAASGG